MSTDRQIGIWGLILGLFGAAFTVWVYAETRQFSQITYSISHETIYRPSLALSSSITIPDVSKAVSERVTQSVVTIWNGGLSPFKGEDTRSKLTVSGDSSVSILSSKVVLTRTLPGSSGFSVSADGKRLEVDWRIFDPEEGLQLVILSTGNSRSLDVTGRFLPGQEVVRYPVRSSLKNGALLMAFLGTGFAMLVLMVGIIPFIKELVPSRFAAGVLSFAVFAVIASIVAYGDYRILNYARAYVGDIPPINPDLIYIDVNRQLDYRYMPM